MTPYYENNGITIYNADCADVLPHIDPSTVSLVLTDPPYGIKANPDYSRFNRPPKGYANVEGDDQPFDPAPLLAFPRVLMWGANHYSHRLPPGGRWIVWRKTDASPLLAAAELAWHNGGGRSVDYFECSLKGAKVKDGALHPTQKPTDLMRWVLQRHTEPGDLVLDPYMGSGPVAQACSDLGRRYIGVELVEDYCKVAVDRLRQGTFDFGESA